MDGDAEARATEKEVFGHRQLRRSERLQLGEGALRGAVVAQDRSRHAGQAGAAEELQQVPTLQGAVLLLRLFVVVSAREAVVRLRRGQGLGDRFQKSLRTPSASDSSAFSDHVPARTVHVHEVLLDDAVAFFLSYAHLLLLLLRFRLLLPLRLLVPLLLFVRAFLRAAAS